MEDELEKKNMELLSPIYSNMVEMYNDLNSEYTIEIINENLDIAQKRKAFDPEYDESIYDQWWTHNIKLKVTPLTTYRMIQNQLSLKLFNGKVPSNHIEIY